MDLLTALKVAKAAADMKSEEKRNDILVLIISILMIFVFLFSSVVYMVEHPIDTMTTVISTRLSDSIKSIFGEPVLADGSPKISNIEIGQYSKVEEAVWNFLKGCGFSDIGAAAVMGNIAAESSFNPSANNGNLHFGLCQWGGGRWSGNKLALTSFAQICGKAWDDLQTQLNFFAIECSVSFPNVYEQLKIAEDLEYATDYFCAKYEICPGKGGNWAVSSIDGKPYQDLQTRRIKAKLYLEKYGSQKGE